MGGTAGDRRRGIDQIRGKIGGGVIEKRRPSDSVLRIADGLGENLAVGIDVGGILAVGNLVAWRGILIDRLDIDGACLDVEVRLSLVRIPNPDQIVPTFRIGVA